MAEILTFINWIILICTSVFFVILGLSSFNEKEYRAGAIALVSFILNGLFWGCFLYVPDNFQTINILIISGSGLFGLISLMRFFPGKSCERDTSNALQYDERDNMFARNNIQYYPELMETYYAMRPENESTDRQIHQKPEFGEKEQVYHDPYTAPCYEAAFEYLEKSIPLSAGKKAKQKTPIDPVRFCYAITGFAKFYGACDLGFLQLSPHHFYSHKGRHAANWGDKTDQTYKTAIAIVIPMRVEMIKKGPTSFVLQESAQKYVEAARISNLLAGYIRSFGYRARAHNDANYDTLCVPIAPVRFHYTR